MKKILLLGLTVILSLSFGTSITSAKTKTIYKNGTLKITGTGKYTSLKYAGNKRIKKLIIGKNVIGIDNYCFADCKELKKVVFNKKLKTIGHESFKNTAVKKVVLSKKTNVGDGAFYNCKKLQSITMRGKIKKYKRGDNEIGTIANKVKKVKFLTPTNMYTLTHINPAKYNVYKKDKKYKSINGGVYRRKDYLCVIIPEVEKFTVSTKSKTFDLDNIYHSIYRFDDTFFYTNEKIKKIILPKTINKIVYTKRSNYKINQWNFKPDVVPEIIIQNTEIDSESRKVLDDWIAEKKKTIALQV